MEFFQKIFKRSWNRGWSKSGWFQVDEVWVTMPESVPGYIYIYIRTSVVGLKTCARVRKWRKGEWQYSVWGKEVGENLIVSTSAWKVEGRSKTEFVCSCVCVCVWSIHTRVVSFHKKRLRSMIPKIVKERRGRREM